MLYLRRIAVRLEQQANSRMQGEQQKGMLKGQGRKGLQFMMMGAMYAPSEPVVEPLPREFESEPDQQTFQGRFLTTVANQIHFKPVHQYQRPLYILASTMKSLQVGSES